MLKRMLLTVCMMTAVLFVVSQNIKVGIKGIVKDTEGLPVSYASVLLLQDGKTMTGALTDTLGSFQIKGSLEGTYILKVGSIGYVDERREVACSKGALLDVGTLVLKRNLALQDVVITADAPEKNVTAERTRITPASSTTAMTGSLLDLLQTSSSVSVDADGKVSIRGNSNVLILVDGVPTTLGGLESIPAANVQSIDIVNTPDVKYDSEGTGGIISIVSKKQTGKNFNGMASFNYGFLNFWNGNLALSYGKGKWRFRLNYSGKYEKDRIESSLHRQLVESGNSIDQLILATKRVMNHTAGVNVSYQASKKDVLTLDAKVLFPRLNNFQDFQNHYVTNGVLGEKLRQTDITFNRECYEGAIGYQHKWIPGKQELSVLASVSSITGHRPSYYYEDSVMVQKSQSGGHPFNTALQADYLTQLGKGKFETGLKMTYRQNNIDHKMYEWNVPAQEWVLSMPLSNDLKHREYIPAAYAMYSSKINDKLTYKVGARVEYSYVTLRSEKEQLDDHSDCWFVSPQFQLNYAATKNWKITFGLSRRISRPTYPQLNPYINLVDNNTYETGNVHLRPEKVNKLDFGYSYKGKKITIVGNAYCNYTQDYIGQMAYLKDNILIVSYFNEDMDLKTGVDHNLQFNFTKWFTMDIATNTYYTRSRGVVDSVDFINQGWVNNSNATLTFKPVKGMQITAQYFVTTPQYFPQFTSKTIHYCNIGIRQSFLKNSLTVSALLTDVFNTRRWDIRADNRIYTLVNDSKSISRIFWLGVTYNFNSFKPAKMGQKKMEEDRSVIRWGE